MPQQIQPPSLDMDNRDLVAMLKDVTLLPVKDGEEVPWPVTKANEYAALCHTIGEMLEKLRYDYWSVCNNAQESAIALSKRAGEMKQHACPTIDMNKVGLCQNRIHTLGFRR